jgi:signal recognition particle subunit SRP54
MTGQVAVDVASTFNKRLEVTGLVLTKLDGDTRGGAALSMRAVTGKPIKYCSIGEKLSDIEPFYPDRMASRILGMGDVLTLIEKAEQAITEEDAKKMEQKLRKNAFTLEDYLEQFEAMKKMGGLTSILSMLPGMGMSKFKINPADLDEKRIEKVKAIILSMTPAERRDPTILNSSRKQRIAKGAGTDVVEVNRLLKQYDQTKLMMKQMRGNKMFKF